MDTPTLLGLVLIGLFTVVLPIGAIIRIIIRHRKRQQTLDGLDPGVSLAHEVVGRFQRRAWTMTIHPDQVVFNLLEDNSKTITIPYDQARTQLQFTNKLLSDTNLVINEAGHKHELKLDGKTRLRLYKWMPSPTAADLERRLQAWGLSISILGIIQLALPGNITLFWAITLVILGQLHRIIKHRNMLIASGLGLLLASISNFFVASGATSEEAPVFIAAVAVLEIIWAVFTFRLYADYPH